MSKKLWVGSLMLLAEFFPVGLWMLSEANVEWLKVAAVIFFLAFNGTALGLLIKGASEDETKEKDK